MKNILVIDEMRFRNSTRSNSVVYNLDYVILAKQDGSYEVVKDRKGSGPRYLANATEFGLWLNNHFFDIDF